MPRKQSFLGGGSLLPLLIGAGTGVALLYLLNNHQKSTRRAYVGDISRTGESDFLNAGDHENFAKYVGAEHEIEEGRERLNDRDKSVAKKKNPPVKGGGLIDEEDETVVSLDKARSARQGKS